MAAIAIIIATDYQKILHSYPLVDEAGSLRQEFRRLGVESSLQYFTDPSVDWSSFDAVVPKSVWDYVTRPDDFVQWLDQLTASGVRSVNDVELIKWNHNKSYLLDLRNAGLPVASFIFFPPGSDPADVVTRLHDERWDRVVLKPSISGGAWKTGLIDVKNTTEIDALSRDILKDRGLIAQPFFEELQTNGEWSLFFVNGDLTHAVLKRPMKGDFRSQPIWGAKITSESAPDWLLGVATKIMSAAPTPATYGRVDGFIRHGQFQLMELELIEPYFFPEYAPNRVLTRFAQAIIDRI